MVDVSPTKYENQEIAQQLKVIRVSAMETNTKYKFEKFGYDLYTDFNDLDVEMCSTFRVLRVQVFSIRTGTGKFPPLLPRMRTGPGILYLETQCREPDWEWVLISPATETGTQ